jgi:hypothetical protein
MVVVVALLVRRAQMAHRVAVVQQAVQVLVAKVMQAATKAVRKQAAVVVAVRLA